MKAYRIAVSNVELLDPQSAKWAEVPGETVDLVPTPIQVLVNDISPFLAVDSTDHGSINNVKVSAIHNGKVLAIRLAWKSAQHASIKDLNEFVDGVAVLFPLSRTANAVTMGQKGAPVNAWYWKANHPEEPYDVYAEGFGSSERRAAAASGLTARSTYADGIWAVVLQRPLAAKSDYVQFTPGKSSRIALAVWDGGNRERSGRKAFSGEFVDFDLQK